MNKTTRTIAICLSLLFIGYLNVSAQKNYALFTIYDVGSVCLDNTETKMYAVENIGDVPKLVLRELANGKVVTEYKAELSEEPISAIIHDNNNNQLFFVTERKGEDGVPQLDAIYRVDEKSEKGEKVFSFSKTVEGFMRLKMMDNYLVLETSNGNPLLFDTKTKQLKELTQRKDIRLIFSDEKTKSFVFGKLGNKDIPVVFMDINGKVVDGIGYFNPDMVISTNEGENRMPSITIDNAAYK